MFWEVVFQGRFLIFAMSLVSRSVLILQELLFLAFFIHRLHTMMLIAVNIDLSSNFQKRMVENDMLYLIKDKIFTKSSYLTKIIYSDSISSLNQNMKLYLADVYADLEHQLKNVLDNVKTKSLATIAWISKRGEFRHIRYNKYKHLYNKFNN